MPLKSGKSQKTISTNIKELHDGEQYEQTKKKLGKKTADKQAVAIALDEARKSGADIPEAPAAKSAKTSKSVKRTASDKKAKTKKKSKAEKKIKSEKKTKTDKKTKKAKKTKSTKT